MVNRSNNSKTANRKYTYGGTKEHTLKPQNDFFRVNVILYKTIPNSYLDYITILKLNNEKELNGLDKIVKSLLSETKVQTRSTSIFEN